MEQTISGIGSSSSAMSHQSKENEPKKRPNFTDADSYPDDISPGKRICVEGGETVQTPQGTILSIESPKKTTPCFDPSGDITLCKESCLDGDSPKSAVIDAYTPADGSRPTLMEESIQTCLTENNETIDVEMKKPIASEDDDQKQKGKVLCSLTGDLLNSSVRSTLLSSTDSSLVSGSAKGTEGSSVGHDLPNAVPALISAEISQSISCCKEDQNSGSSSFLCSEQSNVKAVGNCRKKLLVLDVNGLLADILPCPEPGYVPDTQFAMKAVFQRTFCRDFLQFCFDNFNVGVWSSRNRKNVDSVVDFLMGDKKKNLLFCWDQSHCTNTGYGTVNDRNKPLFLKEIKKLWDKEDPNLPWEKGDYNESNSLLMDDSPHKALRNPPHTGIFPYPYVYKDQRDTFLGPKGGFRSYLQRLVKAEHVQKFVEKNPFGQRPITKSNSAWAFYSKIITPPGSSEPKKKGDDDGSSEPKKKGDDDRSGEPKLDAEQDPPCEEGVASASDVTATCDAAAEGSAD